MKGHAAATLWEVGRVEEAEKMWEEALNMEGKSWEAYMLWKFIEFKVSQNKVEEIYEFLRQWEVCMPAAWFLSYPVNLIN